MMKASISLAVLCLLGEVSSKHLSNHATSRWEPDYQGKFAQRSHRHHHMKNHQRIQNKKLAESTLLAFNHENDTEDVPSGLDPYQLSQLAETQQQHAMEIEQQYAEKEDADSYEFLQTHYEHEDDTEDIPAGLDPIELGQAPKQSALAQKQERAMAEVDAIVDESGEDLVQLSSQNMNYGSQLQKAIEDTTDVMLFYSSHENDTDDIAEEVSPDMYDHHHSKIWNEAVNTKALELEQTMKIEDNIEESKVKAKDEAERRAVIVKFNEEQEKKKFLAQKNLHTEGQSLAEQRIRNPYKTIDLNEVYSAMV